MWRPRMIGGRTDFSSVVDWPKKGLTSSWSPSGRGPTCASDITPVVDPKMDPLEEYMVGAATGAGMSRVAFGLASLRVPCASCRPQYRGTVVQ
eukprot:3887057-Pyramimonas_sp.AAC.1